MTQSAIEKDMTEGNKIHPLRSVYVCTYFDGDPFNKIVVQIFQSNRHTH